MPVSACTFPILPAGTDPYPVSQLHEPLIIRSQGGTRGSHSELTPYGEEFLKRYARFSEETRSCSKKIFERMFRRVFKCVTFLSGPAWKTTVSGWTFLLCQRQTDFSLSMLGHLQAVLLNEELSDKISGVYCSPLLRAVETAGHMAPELPHIIVSDLSEQNLGEWDGLSFDEIRQRWPDIYKRVGITLIIRSGQNSCCIWTFAFRRQFIRFFALLKVILQW